MTDSTYNGWTNYETWNVKLWIDNDECAYHYWLETVTDMLDDDDLDDDRLKTITYNLATLLQEYHEENTPETVGVYADLLNAALSEVNWHEIATSLIDSASEE